MTGVQTCALPISPRKGCIDGKKLRRYIAAAIMATITVAFLMAAITIHSNHEENIRQQQRAALGERIPLAAAWVADSTRAIVTVAETQAAAQEAARQAEQERQRSEQALLEAEQAEYRAALEAARLEATKPIAAGVPKAEPTPAAAGGRTITMTATAYCLTGTTANGSQAGPGIIAVDPSVIPLGSHVYVSGYGDAIAADTGGAIVGNIIDVWLPCGAAIQWGRQTVMVTIY